MYCKSAIHTGDMRKKIKIVVLSLKMLGNLETKYFN